MKHVFTKVLALILIAACLVVLVGCGSDTTTYYYDESTGTWLDSPPSGNGGGSSTGGNNNTGNGNTNIPSIEIGKVDWTIRYTDSDGMITPVTGSSLSIDKNYTLELKFSITANADNDGTQMIDTILSFADIEILNGNIKEAETGKQAIQTTIDSDTGATRKDITLSFKVPEQKDVQKEITILVGLDPMDTADNSQMTVSFASDDARITGNGADGILRSFSIEAVSLAAPSLFLNGTSLMFNHVKNTTYYRMVVDGVLRDDIIIDATDYDAGSAIVVELGQYFMNGKIPAIARIQLVACNEDTNFKNSPYSNEVTVNFN